jgi:hypothetical protein
VKAKTNRALILAQEVYGMGKKELEAAYIEWLVNKARLVLERQGNSNPTHDEICKCVNVYGKDWEQ